MNILLLILAFTAIAVYEVPGMVRKKQIRELIVFSVLLATGFIISLLQVLDISLPNPIKGLEKVLSPLVDGLFKKGT